MIVFRAVDKETGRVLTSRKGKSVFETTQGLSIAMRYNNMAKTQGYRTEYVQIKESDWEELK